MLNQTIAYLFTLNNQDTNEHQNGCPGEGPDPHEVPDPREEPHRIFSFSENREVTTGQGYKSLNR